MTNWQEAKRAVLETALKMVEKGLVVGKSGNVSLRLPAEKGRDLLVVTPSRREYDLLTVDDIQVVDFNGKTVEGNLVPSVETMLHIGIYKARKNIRAVIHTHSVYATAVGVAGLEIPPIVEDQVNFLGGEIKAAGYAPSGSEELVANVVAALGERNAALLPNHGAVGIGPTMRQALTACEILEKTARIYLYARSLGNINILSDETITSCRAFFDRLQKSAE